MTDDTTTIDETTDDRPDADQAPVATDEQATVDQDEDTAAAPDGRPEDADDHADEERADVGEYLLKGGLVMLVVLGIVATLQFYLSAQTAISRLVSTQYRPVFVAAFNLVVLLAVGIGIAQIVRRLR